MATATIDRTRRDSITVSYEHPLHRAHRALAERGSPVVLIMQRPAHLPRLPQLRPEDPAAELHSSSAETDSPSADGWPARIQWHFTFMWIFVGSGLLYVDLPDCHRPLAASALSAARHQGRVADGAALLSSSARNRRSTPPTIRCKSWPTRRHVFFGVMSTLTGTGDVQTGAVLVAGLADGRLSLRPHLALPIDARLRGLHPRPPRHGRAARLEQFLFDDHRAGSAIPSTLKAVISGQWSVASDWWSAFGSQQSAVSIQPLSLSHFFNCHPERSEFRRRRKNAVEGSAVGPRRNELRHRHGRLKSRAPPSYGWSGSQPPPSAW